MPGVLEQAHVDAGQVERKRAACQFRFETGGRHKAQRQHRQQVRLMNLATAPAGRASLRQPCTTLVLMPCDIATLATDAPGTSHSATICALNSTPHRRRTTVLSLVIASTYSFVDTIVIDASR